MPQADLVLLHAPSVYDFRRYSILYGPVSDVVPSMPIFEMYPIGFTSLASYLEAHGYRVRVLNLAHRMLVSRRFDAERALRHLRPKLFGIDLHWLPHAHGALEIARLCKRLHPDIPIVLGGFSATYFHEELIERPEVDFVLRGDSTEEPLLRLMNALAAGRGFDEIPNLSWKDERGVAHVNPLSYVPQDLSVFSLDYGYMMHAAVRFRDLAGVLPFLGWLDYPITAALTCKGCRNSCRTCGGSAYTFRRFFGRSEPAFRTPEQLAADVQQIARFSNAPVFILGDLRQAGDEYAERFFHALGSARTPLMLELFEPAPRSFFQKLARVAPGFTMEMSLETHEDRVRSAFGRHYTTQEAERCIEDALAAGCSRFDVFFMVGLPEQDAASVLGTVEYCRSLLRGFGNVGCPKVLPFLSPLAPFLDPGSPAFEEPERYGYRLFHRTLEEHRRALVSPSWKYVLNYETRWLSRDELVRVTYDAALQLNRTKRSFGLVPPDVAEAVEKRIHQAMRLIRQIDDIMSISNEQRRQRLLDALKPQVDRANVSTVCEKRELNLPVGWRRIRWAQATAIVWRRLVQDLRCAKT